MTIFRTLIWREIHERRLLLLVSALLGLVPIVLPWMPWIAERHAPEDVRTSVAAVLAVLFGFAVLLMLGSTVVARDLSDRGLGFYFSRPISGWALWAARMAAAWALVVACGLLIVTPAAIVDAASWIERISDLDRGRVWPLMAPSEARQLQALARYVETPTPGELPATPASPPAAVHLLLGLGGILLLLALFHAVSTVVRGRNAWVLVDLAGLLTVAGLAWEARELLLAEKAPGALVWVEWLLVPALLGALLLAGGVQLAAGRTDLGRSHRCLSLTLWPSLLVLALAFTAYSRWVAASTLGDLRALTHVDASPDERWLVAAGPARGRAGARTAFLLDTRSQRSWRLGDPGAVRAWLAVSADASTAVWPRCETYVPLSCDLWAVDLRDPSQPPRRTGIAVAPEPGRLRLPLHLRLALSADGRRLALGETTRLSVHDLSSGRLLAAVAARRAEALAFLSPDEIAFHEPVQGEIDRYFDRHFRIRRFDLRSRALTATGRLPGGPEAVRSPAGDVVFQQVYPLRAGLYDSETGAPRLELEEVWAPEPDLGRFLADGRFVLAARRRGTFELRVLEPSGEEAHRSERPGVKRRRFGGELSPGRLLIALEEEPQPAAPAAPTTAIPGWTTYVLDADTGELAPLAAGVVPLGAPSHGVAQRLFLGGRQTVVRWDPESGELQTVLPPFSALRGPELGYLVSRSGNLGGV